MKFLAGNPWRHVECEVKVSGERQIWSFELHTFDQNTNDAEVVVWDVEVGLEDPNFQGIPEAVIRELSVQLVASAAQDIFPEVVDKLGVHALEVRAKRMTVREIVK